MKKFLLIICALLCFSCGNEEPGSSGQIEFDSLPFMKFKIGDCKVVKNSKSVEVKQLRNVIRLSLNPSEPHPSIRLKLPDGSHNLTGYSSIAFNVRNKSNEKILITCRVNGDIYIEGGCFIPAGGKETFKTNLPQGGGIPEHILNAFFGMNGLPGPVNNRIFPGYDVRDIHSLVLNFPNPSSDHILEISNICAHPGVKFYTREELENDFFPFVDEFGQFSHSEWKEKIHSVKELEGTIVTENKDLHSNPGPENWNRFGGWVAGPQLERTGSFRTEKYKDRWWLVDPEGRLFWSHGLNEVNTNNSTPVTDREHYFASLPSRDEFPDLYSQRGSAPFGYYKGMTTINFNITPYNLMRKYGDSWQEKFIDRTHERLRSWGMNTLGGWTPEIVYLNKRTSYIVSLSSQGRSIEGSKGYWRKFPDPFDCVWRKNIIDRMTLEKTKSAADTFCIGYFFDNELSWGNNTNLAISAIKSPADQPVKLAFRDHLKGKYKTVAGLNKAWNTIYKTWDEFLSSKDLPENINQDLLEFNGLIARQYLKTCRNEIKKAAPGKLYFGARWSPHMYPHEDTTEVWVLRIAGDYCDVIACNRYRYSCAELVPPEGVDKPIIITEWHIGTLDRGRFHFGLRGAQSLEHQSLLYQDFVGQALHNPYIVGSHWFRYSDQALAGRADGENFRIGFVDICDQPYPELVDAGRKIGYNMYKLRLEENMNEGLF